MTNVIQFSPRATSTTETTDLDLFVEYVSNLVFDECEEYGHDLMKENLFPYVAMMTESIRAAVYKAHGLDHDLHFVAETVIEVVDENYQEDDVDSDEQTTYTSNSETQ